MWNLQTFDILFELRLLSLKTAYSQVRFRRRPSAIPFLNKRFAWRTWNFARWNRFATLTVLSRPQPSFPYLYVRKTHRTMAPLGLARAFWRADCHRFPVPRGARGCSLSEGNASAPQSSIGSQNQMAAPSGSKVIQTMLKRLAEASNHDSKRQRQHGIAADTTVGTARPLEFKAAVS